MDENLFILVGTEDGNVMWAEVLREPVSEHYAIEKANRLFSKYKRKGVKVVVWDLTIDKIVHTAS